MKTNRVPFIAESDLIAWRNATFRHILGASILDGISGQFVLLGLIWYVLAVSHSAAATGFLLAAFELPAIVSGTVAGHIVDRFPTIRLFAAENAIRALLVFSVPILMLVSRHNLAPIYIAALTIGVLQPLPRLREVVLVPRIAPAHEIAAFNRSLAVIGQFVNLGAPAVAGVAVGFLGSPASIAIGAILAAIGCVLLWTARVPSTIRSDVEVKVSSIRESIAALFKIPAITIVTAMTLVFFFAYGPLEAALPAFVAKSLAGGPQGLGVLWTCFGVGSLLGLRIMTPFYDRFSPGFCLPLIAILWGASMLPLAFVHTIAFACVFFALGAFVWSPYTVLERTLIQRMTPPHQLGALYGTRSSVLVAGTPAGVAVGAGMLTTFSPIAVIVVSGLLCVGAGVVGLLSPALRNVQSVRQPSSSVSVHTSGGE